MSDRRGRLVDSARPIVSVVMANHNGGRYLEPAVRSVLAQSLQQIELIVSDDASPDGSVAVLQALQAEDPRLRLITAGRNGGPARARNKALAIARGEWVAVVDSDDLIHPERFERLLAAAQHTGAEIVADDLLFFHEDGSPSALLLPLDQRDLLEVDPVGWILAGRRGTPALGYLKPMIRTTVLGESRYDDTLRIGEDYDLVLRLLLAGARMVVVPEPWYLYRRHSRSISHRLAIGDIEAMMASQERLAGTTGPCAPAVAAAFAERQAALAGARDFARLVSALKARDVGTALGLVGRRPALVARLVAAVREHLNLRMTPGQPMSEHAPVLRLGAARTEVLAPDQWIDVPHYAATSVLPPGGAKRRNIWRTVVDGARGGLVAVTPIDDAGRYAAGFIPTLAGQAVSARTSIAAELVG